MLTDGHCFFTYLISNLKNKLNNCNTFNEVIDNCVENVFDFILSLILLTVLVSATQKIFR